MHKIVLKLSRSEAPKSNLQISTLNFSLSNFFSPNSILFGGCFSKLILNSVVVSKSKLERPESKIFRKQFGGLLNTRSLLVGLSGFLKHVSFLIKLVSPLELPNFPYALFSRSGIKAYLRYKMITSQNVLSEAQVKNFLIS